MNDQLMLTDATIEAMLARRAGPGAPEGLAAVITAELEAQPEERRPWWSALVPSADRSQAFRLAWIVAVTGLLLAATVSAVLVGSQLLRRSNELAIIPAPTATPTPTPTATPTPTPAVVELVEGPDILATTKAGPLPAQATCPPGSDPDAPGPPGQERPVNAMGAMSFDRHAGRIVALATDDQASSRTYTFDVCTNTWQRMDPDEEPLWDDPVRLVYDADSDRTLAFEADRVWSYDLAADRWTIEGRFPRPIRGIAGWGSGDRTAAVYHEPSGLVIVYDGESMWAYDVETNSMTTVRQRPDPSQPTGSDLPDGVTAVVYDRDRDLLLAAGAAPDELRDSGFFYEASTPFEPWVATAVLEIWALDPGTGSWRLMPSQVPAGVLWEHDGFFYGPANRVAIDEANGVTVYIASDGWVESYDGQRSWRAHPSVGDRSWCDTLDPVYDPLNGRIVCRAGTLGGVSAFSTVTGEWRWLVEPEP